MVAPVERRETPCISARCKGQGAGAKVRTSISARQYGMQQQHATTTTTTSEWIGPAQHDAAISATCVRGPISSTNLAITQVALIAASCCDGPIRLLVVVFVVACCCWIPYQLALMLALTFAPCAYMVFPFFQLVQPFHLRRW